MNQHMDVTVPAASTPLLPTTSVNRSCQVTPLPESPPPPYSENHITTPAHSLRPGKSQQYILMSVFGTRAFPRNRVRPIKDHTKGQMDGKKSIVFKQNLCGLNSASSATEVLNKYLQMVRNLIFFYKTSNGTHCHPANNLHLCNWML